MSDGDDDTYQVVTANLLVSGKIIYLNANSGWHDDIKDATVAAGDEVEELLARAQRDVAANQVVDAYAIEITGAHEPISARERIRANGPSVRYGEDAVPANNTDFEI